MSLTRKIAHNTLIQVIGRGGGGVLSVVALALITRYLGLEGYGIYTTIITFLQVFGILINFGLTIITVQMVSERDEGIDKVMSNIATLRVTSSLVFFGLAPIIALFFPYPAIIKIGIALTSFAFIFQMLIETIVGIFQKHLQMDKPALAEFISRVIYVGLAAAVIFLHKGILFIMVALNIANFVWLLIILYYASKLVKLKPAFDWTLWKEILRRAWPIGLSIILNLIYLKADVIILSVYKPQTDVGLYGAPYKLIDALTTFAMMFMGLILPILASAWAKNNIERFKAVFQKTFNLVTIFVVPMIVGTYFVAKKIMIFIASADFAGSGKILSILVIGAGGLFVGSLFAHTIVAIDKQKAVIWGYAIDAALSLVGYIIFIPKYSYLGAAWVTVFSEILIAIISLFIVYKYTGILPKFAKIFFKSALAVVPMAAALYFLKDAHAVISLLAGAAIYAGFIILFRGITLAEVKQIIRLKA